MGVETDTNRIKFGDGSTQWNSLPYFSNNSFKYGLYSLSTNQTTNLITGNHIELDTSEGSLGGLSTGTGQNNGIITLPAGKTYKITGSFLFNHSIAGATTLQLYDRTNSSYFGFRAISYSMAYNTNFADKPFLFGIISPQTNTEIDVRLYGASNTSTAYTAFSWLLIEEYGGY